MRTEACREESCKPRPARMRVAITADPEIPVPPGFYGGIERVVDMLVRGLVERGHDVTLFAHADSVVPCTLSAYPGRCSQRAGDVLLNMRHVSFNVLRYKYDIVHSFGRLAYLLPILPLSIPKIMTYQRAITPKSVRWGERLARGTLYFTGVSRFIVRPYEHKKNWCVVYNGVPTRLYDCRAQLDPDAPLIFLGRIEEIKGPHIAIEVAIQSSRRLILAGNIPDALKHKTFFDEKIAPYVDGKTVEYVGPVNDNQKNKLLSHAAALLMPVLWDEPFGIVMVEALACGTPVIGLKRGSVPEVVRDGVTGFICESIEQMVRAVKRIKEIDRRDCRRTMEEKFSDRAIVDAYENVYARVLRKTRLCHEPQQAVAGC